MKASKKSKIKGAQFYKVGDKVEAIRTDLGAWFTADIIDISPNSRCECFEECQCTYKLLFQGENEDDIEVVERKLNEIREVSYSSISWDDLKLGMKVVINHNIDKPKQWGYWYDYLIEDIQKRNDVYFVKGTLLVGYEGSSQKLSVKIDSENVADVLEIRPHIPLKEKEMDSYETGVKPGGKPKSCTKKPKEYCPKCRNKPKVRCRTCCCCKCGMKKDFELTVQCDECADWYHIYCIIPPIKDLPDNEDWYCPKCNNETHRSKLEMKQLLKKQKRGQDSIKKSHRKNKLGVHKPLKSTEKSSDEIKTVVTYESCDQDEDVEMLKVSKSVPQDSVAWSQIKELFPGYDLIRVTADLTRKKVFQGIISWTAEEFINNDVVNEHLWQEAKQSVAKGKEAFLETVKRIFTCPICCELLNEPITLSCKHNFCIDCFFRSLSVNVYNCALCRVDVIHTERYTVNENLKKALALLFSKKISKKIDA